MVRFHIWFGNLFQKKVQGPCIAYHLLQKGFYPSFPKQTGPWNRYFCIDVLQCRPLRPLSRTVHVFIFKKLVWPATWLIVSGLAAGTILYVVMFEVLQREKVIFLIDNIDKHSFLFSISPLVPRWYTVRSAKRCDMYIYLCEILETKAQNLKLPQYFNGRGSVSNS